MTRHLADLLLAAAAIACLAPGAAALELFGTQTTSPIVGDWGLIRFETGPITGATERIGAGGLGFDGDFAPTGALYTPGGSDLLYRWDTISGARTLVGGSGLIDPPLFTSIAFDARGALFGVGFLVLPAFGGPRINYGLYSIDPESGAATAVHIGADILVAIDFAPDGTLYATDASTIFPLDPETGERGASVPAGGLFGSLDIDARGIVRGVEFSAGDNNRLFVIDPIGGGSMFLATVEEEVRGLASIPAPSALVVLPLAAGVLRRGRR